MDTILLHATAPTLPEDFCPADWQAVADALIEGAVFRLDSTGYSFYNYGDTTPAPENRVYPWLRTETGRPDRWYVYSDGYWLSKYPIPTDTDMVHIWRGTNDAAGLWAYDGGDGTDPALATMFSGSFWEVDTGLSGKFLVGVGTVGSTAVAADDTGGAASTTLTEANIPEHEHFTAANVGSGDALLDDSHIAREGSVSGDYDYILAHTDTEPTLGATSPYGTAAPTAVPTVPPYVGVYFVKRTIRKYYSIPG